MTVQINSFWRTNGWWIIAGLLPLLVFLYFYPHYLRNQSFFWVCVLSLPISLSSYTLSKNKAWLLGAWLMGLVNLLFPTTIGIYLLAGLIGIVLLQFRNTGMNITLVVHILLASPLFTYFSSLVSFPLRLQLSNVVSYLLRFLGTDISLEGNLVNIEGQAFLVDEACAGFYMLGYGLLIGTLVLSISSRNKVIPTWTIIVFYGILTLLLFMGNIIRITLLILFQIPAEHWLHEGLGLLIFALEVMLPFYFLIDRVFKRFPASNVKKMITIPVFPLKRYVSLLILFVLAIVRHQVADSGQSMVQESLVIEGFQSNTFKGHVTKYTSPTALLYIKDPVAPYRADHNPMICWQGSGYSFQKIDTWIVYGIEVNQAELIKDDEKLYTAWWFESQKYQVGSQMDWRRLGLIENENFYLMNLSCNTPDILRKELNKILPQRIISTSNI